MLVRVATFNQLPGGLDDTAVKLLRDTVMAQPGVRAGYHMHSPKSGKGLSIIVFENQEAIKEVGEALRQRPEDQRVGVDADETIASATPRSCRSPAPDDWFATLAIARVSRQRIRRTTEARLTPCDHLPSAGVTTPDDGST